ncbi:hypothetical protein [uncultured Phascolarctobacterium sp.]|uniref:hypothetical protein n=3 Tax=uncultured Phascolarctobacterium sp. TaxID=512296 RepID=UPI0027DEA53A|nr:hypothetical protein [uncultured Phascolarctobacterium sp.]
MGITRRFLRNMDKVTLSNLGKAATLQKVVSTVTAMGFVLQPVAAMAQTVINPVKGGASVDKVNDHVTNVWAGTVVNDVALNVFKQFDVGANDIANMYFKEKDGNVEASNLVNMVGSRININGTVNAIHNKKIGGNLYFLSSDGIAVGAGGVVNAGTLTLMTPSDRFMKTAMAAAGTDGVLTDATNAVINIFDDNYKVDVDTFKNSYLINNWNKFQKMEIAMNKSGTITVNGTINTIDGIRMKAAHINIGKELDSNGKIIKNATAKAVLNSGIVDFKDIVNIKGTNNQAAVDAGLGNDLKAEVTGDGNIVLAAVADTVNHFDDYAGAMSINAEGNNTVQATVDIGNAELKVENATVGTIDITATATSGSGEGGILGVDIASTNAADILGGKIKKTEAIINIDGNLTADNINVAANAENSFEKDSLTEVGGLIGKVTELGGGLIPFGEQAGIVTDNVKIGYAKLASNAEVNIGSGANLTANGNATLGEANDDGLREGSALNISAVSKISAEVGAEVEGAEGAGQGKAAGAVTPAGGRTKTNSLSKVMPGAGVSVVETDNNASVTVAGNLKSSGDANVSAHALNEVEAEAGVSTIDSAAGSQYVNAAVVVANIDNTSKVVLNGTTQVSGELNALAAAKNEVTTTATAETTKDSLVSTAINVTDAASTADLTVGGNIAAGKMNIAADNTISNEIQAATQVGKSRFQTKSQMSGGTLNAILGTTSSRGKSAKVDKIGQYISAGAAVNIVDENNSAKVTIQKGAQLTAKDSGIDDEGKAVATINISANNTIEDSFMSATSVVNNYATKRGTTSSGGTPSSGTTQTAALASVGFLQADMDNSAQVVIEGSGDQGTGAPVIKGANVNINANSAFEYDRLGSMIDSLKKDYGDIVEKYKEVPGLLTAWTDALDKSGQYLANPSVDGAMDVAEAFQNAVDTISLKYADTAMGVPDDLQTLMEDLLAFADVSNYTNFYTAASTAGGSVLGTTSGKEQAQLSLAGSININSIKNNAQVIVGKGAQLDASVADGGSVTKGELNISAAAKQHDVALNGKTKYFIPTISNTGGGATAIGGSVGVHDADVNSLVVVGEGARLSGNDVSLKAENDLQHTAITFGGGKAANQGITGMFAYMEGQSNSIISVDDEASISAAQKVALDANNNTTISNIIFDRTSAGGTAMGASIGIVDYKVNNIAAVADNDSDGGVYVADEQNNEKDTTRDEVKDLRKLVNDQLSAEEKAQLGTKAAVAGEANGKGKITANAVKVNAETSGTITGVSVAGVTAGASQPNNRGTGSGFKIPAQIAGAGSASVNEISGNTAALLEGVEVTTAGTNRDVKVSASDDSMIGAYSGAAALKKQGAGNSSKFGGTLAGAVAYNGVKTGVTAQIKDAAITDAQSITNLAAREGAVVAAGLALGVDTATTGGATSVNAGVSASVNEINNSTHAVMNNVTTANTKGKTTVNNIAQSKDVQVAGGITAQYAKGGGIGIGAAVSSLHAANDIQSRITNSDLNNVGTLKAYAQTDLVQVGTVLSAGVIQGQNGNGVQAAVADNQLDNNVNVTIEGKAINAEAIDAKAFDGEIIATTNHLKNLADEGFDVDGKDAMADVNATQADVSVDKDKVGAEKKGADGQEQGDDGRSAAAFEADDKKGNLIVSGAVSIIANTSSQGKVAAGAAAVNQKISNNFTTHIKGAAIHADTIKAKAESDTLMVGTAAGVAVSTGQQGVANIAGSVGVMQLDNNTTATIEDSRITANAIEAKAENKSRLINVAGQVSVSKGKVAAGLATATNILHNTTGAYVYDSELNGKDAANGAALTVAADNKSEAYAVAVGVAVQAGQQGAALSGDVAVNKGVNNTEAIVGKKAAGKGNAIADIDKVTIKAVDSTKLKAISGGVTVSTGHAGLGGAVAYNEVGNGDSDKQSTLAKLSDTSIKTAKAATIDVQAEDKSKMLAIAVGAAVQTGQTGAAAQGSAATTILHKNVEAAVSSVDVDKDEAKQKAALKVTAKNTSEAITSADVVAFSTGNFAGGAAVAVTNSDNDTKASISGGTLNLKSGKVQADSKVDIINVGIGVAAATGQGGALAGNVAVNNIKNDTLASISDAAINAKGTLGVLADSKEHIRNYAGALAVTAGQGYAAGGLSTAVNVISGDTKATVSGSAITAVGDDAGITVTEYAKDKKDNKEETLTGFVVNADSAHEIDNVVITGGVAATAEFAVAGTGTVTVNTIKGETEASITGTNVNAAGAVGEKADVSVRANDNTKIDSHVGSASIAASANGGVGVGIASDSNVMSRKVTARIAGSTDKKTVNADKLTVNAFNKHDITSSTTGVAVGAGGYAGVGVAGTISVVKTDAETTAEVENIASKNNGLTVNADHVNKLLAISNSAALGGAIGGASVGAGVSIVQDGSKTQAALKDSNIDHEKDNAQDSVTAHNDTDLTSSTASGAVSISIGAGVSDVITINNMDNTVQATVQNSSIGENQKAGKITVDAANDLKTKFVAVSAAGGLVGVGMGIGVNTIDTSVVTNVIDGSMNAKAVEITANENRDIAQTAVSAGVGGVAGSATVMVTNIGSKVSDTYGLTSAETVDQNGGTTTVNDVMTNEQQADISGAFTKANESAAAQDKLFGDKGIKSNDVLLGAGTTDLDMGTGLASADYKTGVQANKGGDTVVDKAGHKIDVQGVKVNVSNADITTTDTAKIKANANTDAKITVGNAAAGAASVGSTVGVLDVKRNSGVNITGGNISANNLTVGSDQSGTATVDVHQAAASGANFGLFYSGVHLSGNNDINIKGAQLSGKNGVSITTNDTTTASLQTVGGSFALTENANIFVVDGKNESSSTITVNSEGEGENKKDSEIKAENGDVVITAKHGDGTTKTMSANIIPVSVAGVASGLGFNAMVEDNSITAVDIKDNQQFTAKNNVNINAENNSVNEVTSVAANAALGVAVGATGVQAKGKATSKLTVGSNNTFTGNTVNLGAKANVNNKASITSIGAGFGNFMVNWATANGGTDVDVNIGYNTYNTENVNIKGESVITQDAHAQGFTTGMYTSGTNLAKADSNEDVDVTVGGNKSNDKNNVKIEAKGTINQNVDSQGYGGAYFDVSPAAAITKSNIASKTNAKVTGTWAAKTMDVSAVHDNNVTLKTDAIKAAAVGLSGVWSFSDVTNNTGVTLEDATITTDGDVAAKAQNDITYTNEVLGGGYGALVGNAMDAQDKFALNTNVALKNNSNVTSNNGKIEMSAITGDGVDNDGKPKANIDKKVTLKSAGLIAGSLAFSQDAVNINNAITVGKGSALATQGNSLSKDANDINLIAADMLGFTDVATADTQGGAVGAASTKLNADFERNNTITINGTVDSNYDAAFNAGGNSIMNVTLRSNAYNKTAAPIVANPALDYKMKQANVVSVGSNGDTNTIQTARNINLIGDTGNTTIATEAKSWKWTDGGETGTGSLASTADGTQSSNDELNNGVQVDGKLLAGKNSKLDITIDNTESQKNNLDAAIQEATGGVTLQGLGKKLDQAQEEYDADAKVKELAQKRQELSEKEDQLTNNSNVYEQLSSEKSYWQNKVDNAKADKKQAEAALQTFKNNTLAAYNEDHKDDTGFTALTWDELEVKINTANSVENKAYAKKLAENNKAVTDATEDLAKQTAKLEKKNKELGQYNTNALSSEVATLKGAISTLEAEVKNSEVGKNLANAKAAYEKAIEKHEVTADTINTSIFKDKEGHYLTIAAPDWFKQQYGNVYKDNGVGMADYAAGLLTRLNELTTIMQSYKGTDTSSKYAAELKRIQSELVALGLGYQANGNFMIAENASTVPTIELKDLTVSGGNIDITGGYLKGGSTGKMTAVGDAQINIENKTNFFLKVNNVSIDDAGGSIKFNDTSINKQYGNIALDATPSKATGSNAKISIKNTTNVKASDSELFTPDIGIFGDIKNPYGIVEITNAKNSVYVAGKITNEDGTIKQNAGSIKGRSITLTAGNAITQGYSDGIKDVAGTPKYSVEQKYVEAIQKALIDKVADKDASKQYYTSFATVEKLAEFIQTITVDGKHPTAAEALQIAKALVGQNSSTENGIAAAGAIYINAASINVNGTIQSGASDYSIKFNNKDISKLQAIKKANGELETDDSFYKDNPDYRISDGNGFVYNDAKHQYEYQIEAWYNPATGTIITEDVEQSGGGRIYLSGAIANTNSSGGKLVALDGGANINIDTSGKGYNLKLGKVNADKVEGIITIDDTNTNKTTVYKRGSKTVNGVAAADNLTTYNPETGLYYNWTNGESSQVITSYKRVTDSKWFGLSKKEWEDEVSSVDQVTKDSWKEEQITLDGKQKEQSSVINKGTVEGDYVGVAGSEGSKNSGIYQITFERSNKRKQGKDSAGALLFWRKDDSGNDVLTTIDTGNPYYLKDANGNWIYEVEISDRVTTTKKKGLTGLWGKKVTTTWKETKGMMTAYNFGLKADNAIGIEFVGNAEGSSLNVKGSGDVLLSGDIRANDVAIKSNKGSILADSFGDVLNQKAIFSDNLKLQAGKNIEVVQQGVAKALNLNAQAGTTKDNYIKINTLAGISTGDVYLENVTSTGDIILDIQGKVLNGTRPEGLSGYALRSATGSNGTQTEAGNITAGGKLFLKSAAGIGEKGSAHIIKVGDYAELIAEAGDIWAEQAGPEAMKLKQVQAKAGNVHLKAYGGFVDALAENQTNTSNQEERLQEWKDQGILSDTPLAEQKKKKYDEQVEYLTDQAKTNNILGDGYKNQAERDAATKKLIDAGQQLTTDLAGDYNSYYAARKEMYAKQAALNEAISAKNNGDASGYEAALSTYNAAFAKYAQAKKTYEDNKASKIDAYVSGKGYTDAAGLKQKTNISQWLANYDELTHEAKAAGENRLDKYGWNQNQLLYALQDSIINPSAGSVSDVNKANIIGNNIYLTTANGDLGKVADDQAFNIKLSELETLFNDGAVDAGLLKKMNKLAGARADDVTWGTSEIKVQRLTPISVKLNKTNNANDGKVTINAPEAKNIYLIAKDSKLTMDKVISTGNVRLTGQEGIDIGTITGSNISLEGGRGDIKHGESNVLVGLVGDAGKINANTAGTILLKQLTEIGSTGLAAGTELNKNMILGSLAAKNISIEATGNILSGSDKLETATGSETRGISYINAGDKLTLKTSGSVGTAGDGLRIKNSGGVVEIDAQNGAYLEAKGDGTLVLGTITTGAEANDAFVMNSEGSVSIGREADAANGVAAVAGSLNVGAGDAQITAANDITISGKVKANKLTTQSYAGDIKQTTKTAADNIEVEKMNVSAITGDISLNNEHNIIKDISITGLGKTLDLVVSMENLNLNLGSKENALSNNYGGDFKINNNAGNINVVSSNANIYGNIELKAAKDITVAAANEDAGNMGILATNQKVTYADGSTNEAMLQQKGNITLTAGNSITNNGMLIAGAAAVEGAEANVTLNAVNTIMTKGTVKADGSISGTAENGPITIGAAMNSENGGITLETNKDITINGALHSANGDIKADSKQGNIENKARITVDTGNVEQTAKGNIKTNAAINSGNDVKLSAGNDVTTSENGTITSGNDTKLNAGNNITTNGAITSTGNTSLNAKGTGAIKVNGTVNADGSISGTAENGPITIGAAMNSENGGITLETNKDITINGALHSANGDIKADSKQCNIDNNANITVENGNINEKADGYIKSKDNGSTPITLKSINGSIKIEANGDINLYEVIANKGKADIESANGNIYLRNVNGKEVVLITKKEDAKLKADNVIAGTLTTNSDDTDLGISFNSNVRDDGYIEIDDLTGNDGNSAIKKLNLNVKLGDLGKGVIINKLWAENANLKLADGTLAIDKLAVENRADFDVNGMTTTVFGVPPQRTGSDSIYWFNVDDFKNNNAWMKLIFSKTKHVQSSDGVLLQLRDYYYAYDQRFTAVDHLNQLLAENKADEYDISFTPSAALFLRYDLYDVHDSVRGLADNDDAEKISIES